MTQRKEVVLCAPPFFRLCGSHNNRLCPSLSYLAAYLHREDIDNIIYNADATASDKYWSMKWMFDNFQPFIDAVDGRSSLYGEVVETIMSFDPEVVVIAGGEPLIATKDWANPFVATHLSRILRSLGVYTVGIGHFFTLDRAKFENDFDCILGGEPNDNIVRVVRERPRGYIPPRMIDLDIVPRLGPSLPAAQQTDFVMTSFGCRFPCNFCLVQKLYSEIGQPVRFVDLDVVVADISQRPETHVYLTDLTFTMAPRKRLREMAVRLREAGVDKTYTIDTRVDCMSEEIVDILVGLGVTRVKLGIEGATQSMLEAFEKRTSPDENQRAVDLLRARGIEVCTYLLIGGDVDRQDYEATERYIRELDPEFVPVAIWAYDLEGDYRYDTQFSPVTLKKWGIEKEVFYKYLGLQNDVNPSVGKLIGS